MAPKKTKTNTDDVSNERTIAQLLAARGYSPKGIAAILGNLKQESGFRPNALQPSTTGDRPLPKRGFGIAQWTDAGRQRNLIAFAEQRGVPLTDLEMQVDFLDQEIQGYGRLHRTLTGGEGSAGYSVDTLTRDFEKYILRPDKKVSRTQDRIAYAREVEPTVPNMTGQQVTDGITFRGGRGRSVAATPQMIRNQVAVGDTNVEVEDIADDVGATTGDQFTFQTFVLGDNVPDKVKPKDKAAYVATKVLQYNFVANAIALDPTGVLQKIFNQAVKEDWSQDRFRVAFESSDWYRNTEGLLRTRLVAEQRDPATFKANVDRIATQISDEYKKYGLPAPDPKVLQTTARNIYLYKQDTSKFYQDLAQNITFGQTALTGLTGQFGTFVSNAGRAYGVNLGPQNSVYQSYVRQLVGREITEKDVLGQLTEQAIGRFPALTDRLRAGATLQDISRPYLESMGSLLDIDANDISFDDPLIQQAFNGSDPSQGPKAMSLYDFRRAIRKDPRWANSPDAQTRVNSAMSDILRDFGIVF